MDNNEVMDNSESEPPSPGGSGAALFLIGKDSHGNWVAQDRDGLRGGLFVTRAEALKFALFENGNRRQAVVMVNGGIELDMTRNAATRLHQPFAASHVQRAA